MKVHILAFLVCTLNALGFEFIEVRNIYSAKRIQCSPLYLTKSDGFPRICDLSMLCSTDDNPLGTCLSNLFLP